MAEWGSLRSVKRYRKVCSVVRRLAEEYSTHLWYEKPVKNWSEDLLYLQEKWGFLLAGSEHA